LQDAWSKDARETIIKRAAAATRSR
jgi:hypothetical protein